MADEEISPNNSCTVMRRNTLRVSAGSEGLLTNWWIHLENRHSDSRCAGNSKKKLNGSLLLKNCLKDSSKRNTSQTLRDPGVASSRKKPRVCQEITSLLRKGISRSGS